MNEFKKDLIYICIGSICIVHYHLWIPFYPMWASYGHHYNPNITTTIIYSTISLTFLGRSLGTLIIPKLIKIFGLKSLNLFNLLLNSLLYLFTL